MHPDSLLKRILFSPKTRQNVSAPLKEDTMRKDIVLVTNNPCFQQSVDSSRLMFLCGTSLNVLTAARDEIHLGSELLTHPLYGNLRPNQQPFRSVLLRKPAIEKNDKHEKNFDAAFYLESISTIEEAVLLYRSYGSQLLTPERLPGPARNDYALVDSELMRESLTQYGLLSD